MSTITQTKAAPSYSAALNGNGNEKSTLVASFNYWGLSSNPEESELAAILSGRSSSLKSVPCPVTDIRSQGLSHFTLSRNGFQVLKHSSALLPPQSDSVPDLHDPSVVNKSYWPELASMLKSQLNVRSAVAMNTIVRDVETDPTYNVHPNQNTEWNRNPRAQAGRSFQPFFIVHGDYTPPGARAHFRAITPENYFEANDNLEGTSEAERAEFFRLRQQIIDAEEDAMREEGVSDQWAWSGKNYAGPRWAMLSVWRPLEPVHRDPLAVMDIKTLLRPDVETPYFKLERVYRDRPGFEPNFKSENMIGNAPQDGKEHQWYYLSQQQPDEVYALKLYDSEAQKKDSDAAQFVAHSAFTLPELDNQPLRRSCEVRMMVIW